MRTSNYSNIEKIQNVVYLMRTKIGIPSARLIRRPITIRGKKYIDFGENLTTGRYCRIEVNGIHSDKRIVFGKNVNIGDNVSIRCVDKIRIGNNVLMGSRVLIIDNSHGTYDGDIQDTPMTEPNSRKLVSSPVNIEDNVWIGEGAVIQRGITLGQGSIVGANSVVTKNVPPNTIVGGVPAKIIKKWNGKEWIKV